MNLAVTTVEVGSNVLEVVKERVFETKDLGTVMLHLLSGGFLAFLIDGRCILAGVAADMIGAGLELDDLGSAEDVSAIEIVSI